MILSFTNLLQHLYSTPENINKLEEVSNTLNNNLISFDEQSKIIKNNISESTKIIHFKDIILEWQQYLNERTQKDFDDEDYFSPNTLESYNRNLWTYVFPYLEEHPESDNIYLFSEKETDEILSMTKSKETQRVILIALRLALDYAKEQSYIEINPIADKKIKTKKKTNKNNDSYEFIEEENRALWINCMIKNMDLKSKHHKQTDAPLAFLFTLLHGTRPEETCGIRWVDVNFNDDDIFIQNAHKNVPIYDENTMKRTGWKDEDGPLKTPESYRHIPIDLLIKDLLIEHKKEQKDEFLKNNKKWSENQYIFFNSSRTPFVPTVLSRNFLKFIRKNKLPHMVLYGLRHSFATHCRYLGMSPEVLAPLMGHTQYETTQKYYIHISSQQKREELQKIQKKDYKKYLGEENKDLIHLQNNITNLKEVQKEDMTHYLELNDETLNVLKSFITQLQEKNIA